MEYRREGEVLAWSRTIETGQVLDFRAWDIRKERTGTHASVEILCQGAVLCFSEGLNVGRDEDRVRLANSAFKHLEPVKDVYKASFLKNDLDMFARGLDDAALALVEPQAVGGLLEPVKPRLLLRPFVIEGGGTIIFAPPGRGKSYTLMLMQVCMDAGLASLWSIVQGKTLLINLERSADSVRARLGNINQVLGLPRDRQVFIQNARGKSLTDVARAAERFIQRHDIRCVFVDSISRAGSGDLNDNQSVNRIIDILNRIAPTWVALAHTPRSDESHIYGGIHFEAGADVVVKLLSEQNERGPLGIGLQIDKENDLGKQPIWQAALEFTEWGLAAVRFATPHEFPLIDSQKKISMRDALIQHLLDVGASDATEVADTLGFNRSNVSNLLNNDPVFIKAGKLSRRQLYGVSETYR